MKKLKLKKNIILSTFSWFFAILSIILGMMIYAKKDVNAVFLKNNFGIEADFTSFNSKINDALNSVFKFGIFEKKDDERLVDNKINYISLGDNYYKTDDQQIYMLDDGIILGAYKEKDDTYSLVVSYSNGVIASYSNLDSIKVKNYDELKKNDPIGGYMDSFKVLLKKDGKLILIDEIA